MSRDCPHFLNKRRSKKGTVLASPRAGTVPFLAFVTNKDRLQRESRKTGTDTSPLADSLACISPGFAPLHANVLRCRRLYEVRNDFVASLLWGAFALLVCSCLAVAQDAASLAPDAAVVVDAEVWPHFNWASFDQDKVVSYGDYQYSLYWDVDQVLVLARRDLRTNAFQVLRLPAFRLTINPKDGHRNTVLGISPADGRLHLSWDHHNNDLRYTRSRAAFLSEPPEVMALEDIEPAQPLMPGAPQRVTYPRFVNGPDDVLFFLYRSGSSGSGDSVLSRYDAGAGTWKMVSQRLFGKEGTYGPWENSTSRNAYLHDVLFDGKGRLHVTWVYREAGKSWASNHDLHYAYSDDQGITWKNNVGAQIADLAEGDPIVLADPGIVVQAIPVYSWLMNQCAMTLDAKNQPHVATYKMPEPFKPDILKHSPPASAAIRLTLYHYWRGEDGTWHGSGPLAMPEREISGIDRPAIVTDADDTVFIYWPSPQGFRCHVAFARDQWQRWAAFCITGPEYTSHDACKHDRRRLREEGILSFTADANGQKGGCGYAFLDFDLGRLAAEAEARLVEEVVSLGEDQ